MSVSAKLSREQFIKALHVGELVNIFRRGESIPGDAEWKYRAKYLTAELQKYFEADQEILKKRLNEWRITEISQLEGVLSLVPGTPEKVPELDFVDELNAVLEVWDKNTSNQVEGDAFDWQSQIARVVEPILNFRRNQVIDRFSGNEPELSAAMTVMSTEPSDLVELVTAPIVLEMNIANLRDHAELADTELFRSIVDKLASSAVEAAAFFAKYPTMARLLVLRSRFWADNAITFAQRCVADERELSRWCSGSRALPLTKVWRTEGDSHCGGGRTIGIVLNDGTKVVYKPRPLGPVAEVTSFLSELLGDQPLATADYIDRHEYGWTKFVENSPCEDRSEVSEYYYRFGETTAALWFIGASDFHSENVVACGTRPVLVDLETLLTARTRIPDSWLTSGNPQTRRSDLWKDLPGAVGMLPFLSGGRSSDTGLDLSVFGDRPEKSFVSPHGEWVNGGTAGMRKERVERLRPKLANQPWLRDGSEIDTAEFHHDVVRGFEDMLRRIRESFTAASAAGRDPVKSLRGARFRSVMRPSALYAGLLMETMHPDFLTDAVYRELHYEIMWAQCDPYPQSEGSIPDELRDLRMADLPVHYAQADSRSLFDWTGTEHHDYFELSSLDVISQHVEILNDENSVQRLIHAVNLTLLVHEENRSLGQWDWVPRRIEPRPVADDGLVAAAVQIGHRLLDAGWPSANGEMSWVTASTVEGKVWETRLISDNLYEGVGGISLFLQRLAEITGIGRFVEAHRSLTGAWLRTAGDGTKQLIGGFEGIGGSLYRAALLDPREWPDRNRVVSVLLDKLSDGITDERAQADILAGCAGAALALCETIGLLRGAHADRARKLVMAYGDRLVERAQHTAGGAGWARHADDDRYLLGFAHGCAGIAYALRRVAEVHVDKADRYLELARAAEALERTHFRPEHDNWDDLRSDSSGMSYSWCNGNVGIGLARNAIVGRGIHLSDERPIFEEEVESALASARADSLGSGDTLCHGDMGVTELFLSVGVRRGDTGLINDARYVAARVCEDVLSGKSPETGHLWVREVPGLLNGSAGVGYQLLRIARPDLIPNVLLLESK